jgi:hypothetical protein
MRKHYRYNPEVAPITSPLSAAGAGFKKTLVVQGLAILAGNYLTKKASEMINSRVAFLQSGTTLAKAADVAVTLAVAGVIGGAMKKVYPKVSGDVFTGGVLQSVSKGLGYVLPSQFGGSNQMLELGEEFSADALDGLADGLTVGQSMSPVGVSELGDNLTIGQSISPVGVSELGEELGFDMM